MVVREPFIIPAFWVSSAASGMRYSGRLDLAPIVAESEVGATAAGVFTTNQFCAAPVVYDLTLRHPSGIATQPWTPEGLLTALSALLVALLVGLLLGFPISIVEITANQAGGASNASAERSITRHCPDSRSSCRAYSGATQDSLLSWGHPGTSAKRQADYQNYCYQTFVHGSPLFDLDTISCNAISQSGNETACFCGRQQTHGVSRLIRFS
jgi:hypothetical protein